MTPIEEAKETLSNGFYDGNGGDSAVIDLAECYGVYVDNDEPCFDTVLSLILKDETEEDIKHHIRAIAEDYLSASYMMWILEEIGEGV